MPGLAGASDAARDLRFLDLSGFGFSGKHAVIDLVREFAAYHVEHFTFEFALLRIQGGILDLESALHGDWSPIRSDAAIRRFKRLVHRLGSRNRLTNPQSWFSAAGWNYDEHYCGQFLLLSQRYIDQLVRTSWVADWPYPMADLVGWELFARKLLQRLGHKRAFDVEVHLAAPDDFIGLTRDYLEAVLASNVAPATRTVVTHNAFEPFQPERCLKYFRRAKGIVVDRDPRDTYVQQLSYRPMAVGVEEFITRFRIYREMVRRHSQPHPDILRIRFEELVTNYETTVRRILDHLEEEPSVHRFPQRYFNPSVSIKNVGVWRLYPRQDEIERIHAELGEYCFE